jgi:hypothetical protein
VMDPRICVLALMTLVAVNCVARAESVWKNGPPDDPAWFPLAVWLQDPARAEEYKAIGINVYVGLWRGPTARQLAELKAAGIRAVCEQNRTGLEHVGDPTIIAWMHGDEPDNAQAVRGGGWGPPVPPATVVERYERMKAADPTRPVLLNLGQGVAWDGWYGRGVRTNKPEDYPEYLKGCDIASFDIYPAVSEDRPVQGSLYMVPYGVQRLVEWTGGAKPVWNCIECTRISNPRVKPTPAQVRTEVWMSLIHGSRGIIYFVHQFRTSAGPFVEAGLLADKEMAEAVGRLNRQVTSLAPVLNAPAPGARVAVASSDESVPVDAMARQHGGETYVFAVAMRDGPTTAAFTVPGLGSGTAEVIDEGRSIPVKDGAFSDAFKGYEVHLYRITAAQ